MNAICKGGIFVCEILRTLLPGAIDVSSDTTLVLGQKGVQDAGRNPHKNSSLSKTGC
jgi:hypothetical protein